MHIAYYLLIYWVFRIFFLLLIPVFLKLTHYRESILSVVKVLEFIRRKLPYKLVQRVDDSNVDEFLREHFKKFSFFIKLSINVVPISNYVIFESKALIKVNEIIF